MPVHAYCLFCETQRCRIIAEYINRNYSYLCFLPQIIQRKWVKGVPKEERDEMLREVRRIGLPYIKEHTTLMPGAREMLDWLKEKGFTLCIATTTDRSLTEERLIKNGVWDDVS